MQLNTEVLELLFHVVLFFVYPEVSRKVEDEQGISSRRPDVIIVQQLKEIQTNWLLLVYWQTKT